MKEAIFVKQNVVQWQQTEMLLDGAEAESPDVLADAYILTTSDLAFAQTHYPQSRTTQYLNALAFALHNTIYRYKREPASRLLTFWTREVPLTMWQARRELLISFIIFTVSMFIGVVSTLGDSDFPRVILGDDYVDMTLENIAHGEPMAVYDSDNESTMFLGITLNNVWVSFRIFALGVLTSFGTGYGLLSNGVMVGAFQTFFIQEGLGWSSFLAIWLHGTLEISSIIVAGAAGLALGNGWLFPGTYGRMASFRRGARRGLKIIIGTVPIFVCAAFIEGFLTRHTEWPDALRLVIILLSFLFVVFYFVLLPQRIHQQTPNA